MSRSSDRRDAAALHISQRLAETNGQINPNALYRELKASGQGYRKQDFLKDFAGIKGTPQKEPTPAQINGGILSGVMRRKDVRSLPPAQQKQLRAIANRGIAATSQTGEEPWRVLKIVTKPGGTLAVYEKQDFDEALALEDKAEVRDSHNIGEIEQQNLPMLFDVLESIYERLT